LYVSPSRKNCSWYVGPSGSSSIANEREIGVGDVLGLHVGAVLVLEAVLEREGPLGVVLVGLTEVGRHVGDELHLAVLGLYAYCVSARVTRFMISVESVK
jgi:hypothetical protein